MGNRGVVHVQLVPMVASSVPGRTTAGWFPQSTPYPFLLSFINHYSSAIPQLFLTALVVVESDEHGLNIKIEADQD